MRQAKQVAIKLQLKESETAEPRAILFSVRLHKIMVDVFVNVPLHRRNIRKKLPFATNAKFNIQH